MTKGRKLDKVPPQLRKYSEQLVERSSKGLGTRHGESKPVSVMLPPDIDKYVRSLPNRSAWIRQAIREKIERENQLSSCSQSFQN